MVSKWQWKHLFISARGPFHQAVQNLKNGIHPPAEGLRKASKHIWPVQDPLATEILHQDSSEGYFQTLPFSLFAHLTTESTKRVAVVGPESHLASQPAHLPLPGPGPSTLFSLIF